MSSFEEFDKKLEQLINDFTLRIIVPRWTEFESVWEAALRVCDRYELGKGRQGTFADQTQSSEVNQVISSGPSAVDAPAQTHPPIAA